MLVGIYIGSIKFLVGKRALLEPRGDKYFAQFDDLSSFYSHGWHEFNLIDFELEVNE